MSLGFVASGIKTEKKNAAGSNMADIGTVIRTNVLARADKVASSRYKSVTKERSSKTPA